MALLKDKDRRQLTDIFARQLQDPVALEFFTQKSGAVSAALPECQTCRETEALLQEVAALSDKIGLTVRDFLGQAEDARSLGVDKIPCIVMKGKNKGTLRYYGVPAGYEFGVLIEDMVDLSRGGSRLTPAVRKSLSELHAPVHIQVLVTPT
jgi:alkyl hydroperoxide reductase subunit AhpF